MPDPLFQLDLKPLTAPVVKLIEAIRDGIGAVYEPTRIRRKAKADADAGVILAKSQANVRDVELRANQRLRNRELRRQENIEKVAKKAVLALPQTVSTDPVDPDWITQFLEGCQDISNEEMQTIWGKILAGEVAKPRSFSLRTVRIVKDLSRADALMFTDSCRFLWNLQANVESPFLVVHDTIHPIYTKDTKGGSAFGQMVQLESMGLVRFEPNTGYTFREFTGKVSYFGREWILSASSETKKELKIGEVILTPVGMQLSSIAGAEALPGYAEVILDFWRQTGWSVAESPRTS